MNGPRWIKQWIADLALLNEQFRNDDGSVNFEELGREEYMFRTALITQKLDKSDRARDIYMKAKAAYDASSENGKKGGRPRKNQETTADAPTREDGVNESDGRDAVDLESSTSANIYGVAPHREAGDVSATDSNISQDASTGNGEDESLVHPAPNMRRVPQNEAPAHGFSGGRTAQGTMSRSPEAAAQSGNIFDQETDQISTDEARQSLARESRRTGGSSARGMAKVAQPPVRSLRLPTWDEFSAFIDAQGLDYTDAREWWEMTMVDRDGHDRNGKPIRNWKITCRRFCEAKANKRKTA